MTAQQQMIAKYGLPDGVYQSKFCELWKVQEDFSWFPVTRIFINSDFKDMLVKSFIAVENAGLQHEIKVFSGCLVVRPIRGSANISMHSWGSAIDLNAQDDPMVIEPLADITPAMRLGKWSQGFVDAMTSSGISFGGNFIHRPDPMHFSMLDM